MRTVTLRDAAGAALRAMHDALEGAHDWRVAPGVEAWATLANAYRTLQFAVASYDEAHALAMLRAGAEERHNAKAGQVPPEQVDPC